VCGSIGSAFFAVAGASVNATPAALLRLHPGAAIVALISVCIGCRSGPPGACWIRLTKSILMVAAMWSGMLGGCLLAMRLALLLRMPSATLLSWTMMALGMFVVHGTMSLCVPAERHELR